ncbi:hypothetical protein QTP70_018668 [Hemibagrus guttatus]|uniref:Uncharacterized protein n=1 Tax=Hemibagrus guttatus TaxID=175788 RepID=A0AAE0Q6V8_9TELE|nr:hypothetical protein QTP70_018668 [Hemibagrus guttatus]
MECDAVIIGDSIVRHIRATTAKGKVRTRCLPGARVLDVSAQVPAILKKNSGAVVLHAGTNDIRLRQTEILKKDFRSLVEKFADDTTVIRLITCGEETSYRTEVAGLIAWCQENNLSLNTDKTKEMIIDPRRRRKEQHTPIYIGETDREGEYLQIPRNSSERGLHLVSQHSAAPETIPAATVLLKKAEDGMSAEILSNFYRCTVESVITSSITVWHGSCTVRNRKALQRVIKTAQLICGAAFPSLQDICNTRVIRRAHNIIRDNTHPQHNLFTLLPSGRCYRSVRSRTKRLTNSFYSQTIRLLNNT